MSIKVMHLVWEYSKHSGGDLLTMLAIADHASDDGEAFPGIERLAKKTRLQPRHIYRILPRLEQSQELTIHHGDGPNGVNRYQVNLARLSAHDTPDKMTGDKMTGDKLSGVENHKQLKKKDTEPEIPHEKMPYPDKMTGDKMSPLTKCQLTFEGHECHPNHQEPSEEKEEKDTTPVGVVGSEVSRVADSSPTTATPHVAPKASKKKVTPLAHDDWLYDLLTTQDFLPDLPFDAVNDADWWASLSHLVDEFDEPFMRYTFASMATWLKGKPRAMPRTNAGWVQFIRNWLVREGNDQRRRAANAGSQRAKEVHIHYR